MNYNTNAYRAIYTILKNVVYILHCFQKKSKTVIKTPKENITLIKQRLYEAQKLSLLATEIAYEEA